jgi:hypothetical protein
VGDGPMEHGNLLFSYIPHNLESPYGFPVVSMYGARYLCTRFHKKSIQLSNKLCEPENLDMMPVLQIQYGQISSV